MLRELLSTYGYGAVILASFGDSLGLPLPGETLLVLAGGLAASGTLDVLILAGIAWCAVVAADGLTFAIGRFGGRPFIVKYGARFGLNQKGYDRAQVFFDRWGGPGFVVGRFLPVLRAVLPPMLGATGMYYWRFAPWQMVAAAVWVAIGIAAGYAGGGLVKRLGSIVWTDAVRYWPISAVVVVGLALLGVVVASREGADRLSRLQSVYPLAVPRLPSVRPRRSVATYMQRDSTLGSAGRATATDTGGCEASPQASRGLESEPLVMIRKGRPRSPEPALGS